MEIEVFTKKQLLRDLRLLHLSHEAWLFFARTHMSKEDWWTPDQEHSQKELIKLFEESYAYYTNVIMKLSTCFCTLACEDMKIIGILLVDPCFVISDLGVSSEYSERKISYKMLDKTVDYILKNYPNADVYSYVKSDDRYKRSIYEKSGFKTDNQVDEFRRLIYQYDKTNLKRKIKK